MTHIPSRSEFWYLMEQQVDSCISLFLPTERAGEDYHRILTTGGEDVTKDSQEKVLYKA